MEEQMKLLVFFWEAKNPVVIHVTGILVVVIMVSSLFIAYSHRQKVTRADTGRYNIVVINKSQIDLGNTDITFYKLPAGRLPEYKKERIVGLLKIPMGLVNR